MPYLDDEYAFLVGFLPPLALAKGLPAAERPSLDYIAGRAKALAEIGINMAAVEARSFFDPLDRLQDYEDVFPLVPRPGVVNTWRDNLVFAEQRLSGMHPTWIRRLDGLPAALAPFEAALGQAAVRVGGKIDDGNLYWLEYSLLDGIPSGSFGSGVKYLPRPVAFFYWRGTNHADRGELVPVAILMPREGAAADLVTPADPPYRWLLARTCVQVADVNVHEMRSHLYHAHFAMEPVAVATGRYLPPAHPVRRLLTPHFRFLLFNNELGKERLVNPGGFVDDLLAPPLAGALEIVKRAAKAFDFTADAFPNDVKARGMDDVNRLPHYPYRDDGMLVWDAIGGFVKDYLALHLATDAQLAGDGDLMSWWDSLSAANGANLQGVPTTRDLASLRFILQRLVFTGGPYHAAVNFPQYEYLAFVPNMPGALYRGWPSQGPATESELLAALPPFKPTIRQLEIAQLLGTYRYDVLGHYPAAEFTGAGEPAVVEAFQRSLAVVEAHIDRRNRSRRFPYPYLKPSLVPNSTSV